MVGADSHGISRAPWYSGPATVHLCNFSFTRLSLSVAIRSKIIQLNYIQSTGLLYKSTSPSHNTTITTHTGLHNNGLGSSRFAHHYLGNHFVFFSWPYLDVSVRAVRSCYPIYSDRCNTVLLYWVSHSEISGSMLDWQLPEAYRSLPRPSSPPDTKASTKYS